MTIGFYRILPALLLSAAMAAQQQAPGLGSLAHGVYYQSAHGWNKLELTQSSGVSIKAHRAGMFVGVMPSGVRLYVGAKAANQFDNRHPVFGIRIDANRPDVPGFNASDLLIVRLAEKKDHREFSIIKGGFESTRSGVNQKDVAETTLTSVADHSFTLTPKSELKPGEYLLTFRGANGLAGYEFGVK